MFFTQGVRSSSLLVSTNIPVWQLRGTGGRSVAKERFLPPGTVSANWQAARRQRLRNRELTQDVDEPLVNGKAGPPDAERPLQRFCGIDPRAGRVLDDGIEAAEPQQARTISIR